MAQVHMYPSREGSVFKVLQQLINSIKILLIIYYNAILLILYCNILINIIGVNSVTSASGCSFINNTVHLILQNHKPHVENFI